MRGGRIVPVNYDEVLADLRQMKADAEAGIAAIQRLASSTRAAVPMAAAKASIAPVPKHTENPSEPSVPQRVVQFLESQQGKSFSIGDIMQGAGIDKIQTLRGALGRLVKPPNGKIGKHGRGRYRALRSKIQPEPES